MSFWKKLFGSKETVKGGGDQASFPSQNLRAIILYMQNVSAPPEGGTFAFDVFLSLNNPDLEKLQSTGANAKIQAENIRNDDFTEFMSEANARVQEEMGRIGGGCMVVVQPNTIDVPGTGKRNVSLCSFFTNWKQGDAIILLKPQESYKLS